MAAIIGKKLGMTQVFTDDGSSVPVTVVEAGPCRVTAIRTAARDGYEAVQLAFDEVVEHKLTKAELGHLKRAGAPPSRTLVEFRDADVSAADSAKGEGAAEGETEPAGVKLGAEVTVSSFKPGDQVKVSGVSIGKGFQGTVRRHGFARGPVTHGSHNVRAPGSIGASADPARVFKGIRMPGRMGGKRITQLGLEIVDVDAENNLLLIKGSVPGSRNATVEVRTVG